MPSTSLSQPRRKYFSRVVSVVFVISLLAVSVWVIGNRQFVMDYIVVKQFQPTQEVKALVDRSSMTDKGQFYLYASRAEVNDAQSFNEACQKFEEHSAILGCYAGSRIYIYNVTDVQLDGIKEVTAAHEMLHAAWDRLSLVEKDRLAVLLEEEYNKYHTDELEERMDYYARAQPGERINELHSIIGTEVHQLDEELEAHYARYFIDRQAVVRLHDTYQAVFVAIKSRTSQLETQLTQLATDIAASTERYNREIEVLNRDIESFNTRAENGSFSTQAAFTHVRSTLTARASTLDAERILVNQKAAKYNQLLDELRSLSDRSEALHRSIDSTLALPPPI